MRERMVEPQREAERGNAPPQTVINLGQGVQPPARPLPIPGRPARAPLTAVDGMQDTVRQDVLAAPTELGMGLTQDSARQTNAATGTAPEERTAPAAPAPP